MKISFEERLNAALAAIETQNLNAIVAVSRNGGSILLRECGAPAKDGIPPGATQVDVNSITKTVTGIMAAKLVQQGNAKFDETLGDFFDHVPADKSGITLHQLLTHSAGLIESVGSDPERLSKRQFLSRVFKSELGSPPGEIYRYSNVGFGIVAAIIEARSRKLYEDYLREDVLAELGLSNTGYAAVYDEKLSLRTKRGQSIEQASWGGHEPYWNLIGNGGLVSTVLDMICFRQAVASGKIISNEMLAIVQTPHIKEDEAATSFYGYGLVIEDITGVGRIYWHDGGNGVFSAMWSDYSEHGDIVFTAGMDRDAIKAMHCFEAHFCDYGEGGH
ncbi:MAG: serine hydrolase [Pseudomonadota bacterium]